MLDKIGWHGGEVVVIGGSVVGDGGVGDGIGVVVVVVDALFVASEFLV
jgi:hypothetical protein